MSSVPTLATPDELAADIAAVGRIDAVPTILDVVCRTTGMGFAAVARVTQQRWIACSVLDHIEFGLRAGTELLLDTAICCDVRNSREPIVINNVADDPIYRAHAASASYGFQSYVAVPILLRDGDYFGTLCALDPRPARLPITETVGMFKLFAELIASHLEADKELRTSQAQLSDERKLAELREQFIAVLGHDLRNPVASVASGTRLLLRMPQDERSKQIITLMQGSAARMQELIENLLDFARARLGNGLALDIRPEKPLQPVLEQVVAELRVIRADRRIDTNFDLTQPVAVDHARIAQLLSNLIGNALTHGTESTPIKVAATTSGRLFELSVANAGPMIPANLLDGLFQPFFRGKIRPSQQGLGLGLFIAAEIAKAHGGTLDVSSTPQETRFTFSLPLPAQLSTRSLPAH